MNLRAVVVAMIGVGSAARGSAALLPACDDSTNNNYSTTADSGPTTNVAQACSPGSRSCKSDVVAQVCGADGAAQVDQPCGAGERCSGGFCTSTANPNVCQDTTTALRRLPTGAFEVVKCPAGTACEGAGLCKGAFIVGSSVCSGLQALASSADGLTQTLAQCAANQLCVSTGESNGVPTAACKAAECIPVKGNVAFCGNPKTPTVSIDKAVTKCTETPDGYKFVTALCTGTATCAPGSSGTDNNSNVIISDAHCATACIPGTSRCSSTGGISTCAADGTWPPASTACAATEACRVNPVDPSHAACVDAVCVKSIGVCEGLNFRACGQNGKLGAAAACALGACRNDNQGGGLCEVQCAAGEERCVPGASTSFQTCVNGVWSATATSCAAGGACVGYTLAGKSAKICGGACVPGQSRCTLGDGGVGNTATEACNAAGQWGAPVACTIGSCQGTGPNTAACLAECVPNTLACAGGTSNVPGTPYNGFSGFRSCSATGLLGATTTDCAANTFCRSKNGRAIAPAGAVNACSACVGSAIAGGNEEGLTDSRCASAAGDTTGNETSQICAANNTWTANLTTCANGCKSPTARSGPAVSTCGKTDRGNTFRTETHYATHKLGSCANSHYGDTGFVSCGVTPDCCNKACSLAVPPAPATCVQP
jgi:hypothetical protein